MVDHTTVSNKLATATSVQVSAADYGALLDPAYDTSRLDLLIVLDHDWLLHYDENTSTLG